MPDNSFHSLSSPAGMHEVSRRATDRVVRHAESAHDPDCLHLRLQRRRAQQFVDLLEVRPSTRCCSIGSVGFECDVQNWDLVGGRVSDVVGYEQVLHAIWKMLYDFVVYFDHFAFVLVGLQGLGR